MSNFLLDTHTFIWLSENDSNLSNNPHSADTKANLGIKNLEKEKPEKIA
jgi:PIN domain nuclease of toxin-antitoxin system